MRGPRVTMAVAMGLGLAVAAPAWAQKVANIGSNPPGSVLYVFASAMSKIATDAGTLRLTVQPYAGTSTFLPLIDTGEVELGVNNAVDVGLSYRGPNFKVGGRNPFQHTPNMRMTMRLAPLMIAPVVRRDAPIKTIQDVRGKRVTGEYPANLAIWYNIFGWLASAGMTWSDVKVVPVPGLNEGIDALVQGRADVSSYAMNGAKVREADAAVGVRHLSVDCSPEGQKRVREAVPGYYTRPVKKGEAAAVLEDICVIAYDTYVSTSHKTPDDVVQGLLKAVWENSAKVAPFHPLLKQWTREQMVSAEVTIPYHPAAVRFYQEHKVWTPEMDKTQQRLLAIGR